MRTPVRVHRSVFLLLSALAILVAGCRDSLISPEGDPRLSVGESTVQNCEGDASGGYICDPISGGGGSEPPPEDDPGRCNISTGANCDNFPGSGGGGDGGWGTGGGAGDQPAYDDSPPADDTEFDCHLAAVPCTLNGASPEQKTAMKAAIQKHLKQGECSRVYDTALSLVESSQVWTETIKENRTTFRGDYLREQNQMHIWAGNFASPDKWLPWTLAHEAVHALQFELGLTTHLQIHSYGDSCLNFAI